MTAGPIRRNPVRDALSLCRPHFLAAALFSAVANLLYLAPSLYMLQVYERVVPTGGLVTLAVLSLVGLAALATLSALGWLRARLLVRAGARLDEALAEPTLRLISARPGLSQLERAAAMRDLDTLRAGVAGTAAAALFDLPWTPIYIVAAFLLHPALGILSVVASIVMLLLAWGSERAIARPVREAGEAAAIANARAGQITAYAAEVRALGLTRALARLQLGDRAEVARLQNEAAFGGNRHSHLAKFIRLALQSGALALGAVLVTEGSVSGGSIFAASLLLSRALAPIELVAASWKTLLQSRTAYQKLSALHAGEAPRAHTRLPAPAGRLSVEHLTVVAPVGERVAIADASFAIEPGEVIGVVGMSGAGKSTLLRALVGASPPARGQIRIDGASIADWEPEALARHIGYLPQNFIMFPGTVKENISRFRGLLGEEEAGFDLDAAVIAAAEGIGAHEMILRLPHGYDTRIGVGGTGLSAGQTQRVAIARALFGDPALIVLDEPTAHLDVNAQHAFLKTLGRLRQRRATVLFATHSTDMLAAADKLLVVRDGRIDRLSTLADALPALAPVSHAPVTA
jgi:ATP-binding cassette subfamily C protein